MPHESARRAPEAFLALVVACSMTGVSRAYASPVTEIKDEVRQTQSEIDGMHAQAEETNERILAMEGEIAGLEEEQRQSKGRLSEAQERLARSCQAGYKASASTSPVDAILASSTLDEMVTNLQYARSIKTSMTSKVNAVNEEKRHLDEVVSEKQGEIDEVKRTKEDLERQINDLNNKLNGLNADLRNAVNASMNSIAADANAVYEAAMVEIGDDPTRKALIDAAYSQIGVPYGYGSYAPGSSLDCSGFVMYAYSQIGVSLPHSSVAQSGRATHKSLTDLLPGDLLFWVGTSGNSGSGSHVAMYLGNGKIIHASWEGVIVQNIYDGWNACGSVI